jgi:HEPN domain
VSLGQQELEKMIDNGDLELCPPNGVGASTLIAKARTHHESARLLARTDPETAMDALHTGNRKALEAVLLTRGIRPTKTGGHLAPLEAVRAMLGGGGTGGVLSVYNVVRRARHEGDYSNASVDVSPEDIEDNLASSSDLVDACEQMISIVPVFVRGRS